MCRYSFTPNSLNLVFFKVLICESVDRSFVVKIEMKTIVRYFNVELFVLLYKLVLTLSLWMKPKGVQVLSYSNGSFRSFFFNRGQGGFAF